ncbi:hypothetical protein ABZV31_01505 [Streptomyces sp. NPDC005202]|uniref:hypothetical protein n=1 Tax=Streptomyces sp. NPDC005202 TaxID=3157021 RepID=UPI0033BE947C
MTELVEHGQLFIGGELTDPLGKDVIEVISPHTEEVIGMFEPDPHVSTTPVFAYVAVFAGAVLVSAAGLYRLG